MALCDKTLLFTFNQLQETGSFGNGNLAAGRGISVRLINLPCSQDALLEPPTSFL
jgi:hypothetical protein